MATAKEIIAEIMDRIVDRPGHNMLAWEIVRKLDAAGFVIALKEPTPDMRIAGGIAWSNALPDAETYVDSADACYKAMIGALPSTEGS